MPVISSDALTQTNRKPLIVIEALNLGPSENLTGTPNAFTKLVGAGGPDKLCVRLAPSDQGRLGELVQCVCATSSNRSTFLHLGVRAERCLVWNGPLFGEVSNVLSSV